MQLGVNHLAHFALTGRLLDRLLADARLARGEHQQPGSPARPDRVRRPAVGAVVRPVEGVLPEQARQPAVHRRAAAPAHRGRRADARARRAPGRLAHEPRPREPGRHRQHHRPRRPAADREDRACRARRWARSRRCGPRPIPAVVGGEYFGPDGLGEQRGHPTVVGRSRRAQDEVTARRLWEVSEELTGVHYAGARLMPRERRACDVDGVDLDVLARGWTRRASGRAARATSTPIEGGTQNILLRFTRADREYVFRRPPLHKRANSDDVMRREARILAALAGSDVPHPALIAACTETGAARRGLLPDGAGRRLQRDARAARAAPLRSRDAAAHGPLDGRVAPRARARRSRRRAASATSAASTAGPSARSAAGASSSTATPSSRATRARTSPASTPSARGSTRTAPPTCGPG